MGCAASTSTGTDDDTSKPQKQHRQRKDERQRNADASDDNSAESTSGRRAAPPAAADSAADERKPPPPPPPPSATRNDAAAVGVSSPPPPVNPMPRKVVTGREAKAAAALLGYHVESMQHMAFLRLGQALKDNFGKDVPAPDYRKPHDVLRCATAIARLRDKCGVVRTDGSFLHGGHDFLPHVVQEAMRSRDPRAPDLSAAGDDWPAGIDLAGNLSVACGVMPAALKEWLARAATAADCLIQAATASCELSASPRDPDYDEMDASTVSAAVRRSVKTLCTAGGDSLWTEVVNVAGGACADDFMRVYTHALEDAVLPSITTVTVDRVGAVRNLVRSVRNVVTFFHGGRRYAAPLVATGGRAHLNDGALQSTAFSRLFEHIWRYCAHPSGGMEVARKVEEATLQMAAYAGLLGAMPSKEGALDSIVDAAPYLLGGGMLNASATRVTLYCLAVAQGQLKLDVTGIERQSILDSSAAALERGPVMRAAREGEPLSAKVFPAFAGEAGEGHGPRKEFFDQCARALASAESAPMPMRSSGLVDGAEGATLVVVRPAESSAAAKQALAEALTPGNTVAIEVPAVAGSSASVGAETTFAARIITVRDGGDGDFGVRLGTPLPTDLDGVALVSVSKRQFQCFARPSPDAAYEWFNGAVDDASLDAHGEALYRLAGWLLGAAVANGVVVPLQLPPVLFKLLRQRLVGIPYDADESDLVTLDPSYAQTLEQMRSFDAAAFNEYAAALVGDDSDDGTGNAAGSAPLRATPATLEAAREEFIAEFLVADLLITRCRRRLNATAAGFHAAQVSVLPAAWAVPSPLLAEVVCGAADDPSQDFDFSEWFDVRMSQDFTETEHGLIFGRCILDALRGNFVTNDANRVRFKRKVMQFVTGRDLLPASRGIEPIFIEYGDYASTTVEYAAMLGRLPSSHTCTNTLQVPNYLEAMLLGASDAACEATTGRATMAQTVVVTRDMRLSGWAKIDAELQAALCARAESILRERLYSAAAGADTYELDDPTGGNGNDDDDDDDDMVDRRQSSMLRGISAPARTSTAPPGQLESAVLYLQSQQMPGSFQRHPVAVTQPSGSYESHGGGDDYYAPAEDAHHGGSAAAANPFARPTVDSLNVDGAFGDELMSETGNASHLGASNGTLPNYGRSPGGQGELSPKQTMPMRFNSNNNSNTRSGTNSPGQSHTTTIPPSPSRRAGRSPPDFSKPDMVVNGADFDDDSDEDGGPTEPAHHPHHHHAVAPPAALVHADQPGRVTSQHDDWDS